MTKNAGVRILLLCVLVLFWKVAYRCGAILNDVAVLSEWKSKIQDTQDHLSDWQDSDSVPCFWTGVRCAGYPTSPVIEINLSNMNLSGSIPPSIGKLRMVKSFNLANNNFSGVIPLEMCSWRTLQVLVLRNNSFKGQIPACFSRIVDLRVLDIRYTGISSVLADKGLHEALPYFDLEGSPPVGRIPLEMDNVTIFSILSLSGNHDTVTGAVPTNPVLNMSSEGNPGSCSSYANQSLSICHMEQNELRDNPRVITFSALGASLLFLFAVLLSCCIKSNLCSKENSLEQGEEFSHDLNTSLEVTRRYRTRDWTDALVPSSSSTLIESLPLNWPWKLTFFVPDVQLSETEILETCEPNNLISRGWSGENYKGVTKDGRNFIMKMPLQVANEENTPEILMRLTQLLHPNVVRMLGYCTGNDGSLVALLYDYISGENLIGALINGYPREWSSRFDIALGTARALQYLQYCQPCSTAFAQRFDITSNNILLNSSLKAYLAVRMEIAELKSLNEIVPEENYSSECKSATDVYNFGVVLLELLTGRKVVDKNGTHIVRWFNDIRISKGSTIFDMLDPVICDQSPQSLQQIQKVFELAEMCTRPDTDSRPSFLDVLLCLFEAERTMEIKSFEMDLQKLQTELMNLRI